MKNDRRAIGEYRWRQASALAATWQRKYRGNNAMATRRLLCRRLAKKALAIETMFSGVRRTNAAQQNKTWLKIASSRNEQHGAGETKQYGWRGAEKRIAQAPACAAKYGGNAAASALPSLFGRRRRRNSARGKLSANKTRGAAPSAYHQQLAHQRRWRQRSGSCGCKA